jgi:DNA-binding NtrC family response regulator
MSEPRETTTGRLLIVDDEPAVARVLATYFTRQGWQVRECQSAADALEVTAAAEFDVVITDLCMPEMSGTEFLAKLREQGRTMPVLVITAFGSIGSAVDAMRLGAFDYLSKPFDFAKVNAAVQRAYLDRQLQRERESLATDLAERYKFANLIGSSTGMREVYALIERAARSQATVLVLGESGTGKELVAKALHSMGARANKRFVGVSCVALPSELLESELFGHEKGAFTGANWQRLGRFELADGGTLFLDEIGDISLTVQAKLLRVLQEREIDRVGGSKPVKVDVRLVTATNRDLPGAVKKGDFREDLYYRLRVLEVRLPALRERKEDLPLLAQHFLLKYAKRDGRKLDGFTDTALELLDGYDWPGNVRELENAIERALVMVDDHTRTITPEMLPKELRTHSHNGASITPPGGRKRLQDSLDELERTLVLQALEESRWNAEQAAELLGLSLRTLCHTVRKHHLARAVPSDLPGFP